MRGPKFKLIHKATGLTFKQKAKKENGGIDGYIDMPGYHLIPILLDSGYPAMYIDTSYYPSMTVLPISEWDVVVRSQNVSE